MIKTAAAAALAALLVGCSASSNATPSSDPASAKPTTPAASTEPPPSTQTESSTEPATLADRLGEAGIDCSGQKLTGDVDCTYDGETITVSVLSWSGTEDLRRQACEAGYVNAGYLVATDGDSLTISADFNKTTQAIAKALGLDVRKYCP